MDVQCCRNGVMAFISLGSVKVGLCAAACAACQRYLLRSYVRDECMRRVCAHNGGNLGRHKVARASAVGAHKAHFTAAQDSPLRSSAEFAILGSSRDL
mmetsp:Transcript_30522/g.93349  ORF Transcript_30522/g.93349 Transcript_30522/m.93349 type:complete len:98 (+) Transcript_30522:1592-1885(+)|eukprot:scaffold231956_cov28-Tisochrysis_lutea.AAC.1